MKGRLTPALADVAVAPGAGGSDGLQPVAALAVPADAAPRPQVPSLLHALGPGPAFVAERELAGNLGPVVGNHVLVSSQ